MKKPDWNIWLLNRKECKIWLESYIKRRVLVRTRDESILHLRKTDHNLKIANWIYDKHRNEIKKMFGKETFYDWVINMYYYAVYHSALALLSRKGYNSKGHYSTLCFLIYNFYHGNQALEKQDVEIFAQFLDKEDIETIGLSKELRERASYDVHEELEKQLAEQTRENALRVINKIRWLLRELK